MYVVHIYIPNNRIPSNYIPFDFDSISKSDILISILESFVIYDLPLILQVEVKRTKNTERRVQRQVVLEDGRVLNVGGPPHVVVDTIEDIETHETNHVEDQNIIDELKGIKFLFHIENN